jgi:RHS repeat-associated protein
MRAAMKLVALLALAGLGSAQAANNAAFVSQSVPPVMSPGQSYAVTVTMSNTGTTTWSTAGYRLASKNPADNLNWGLNRVPVPATAPSANSVISFEITAPSTPGTYNFQWQMGQTGVEFFGALSTNLAIKVGLDNAAFVSQSVPSTMVPGQTYPVSVTMQNTGSTTWAAGTVGLGSQSPPGNTVWGPSKVSLASPVAPSAQVTFNFNVTAPTSPGTYDFRWRMVEGTDGWFGAQSANVAVGVLGGTPAANVYFIHTDHLNTPRLVANSSGTTVWKWDQQEPFGVNVADEDPDANSVAFEFPLRFPGQYSDKETNLYYNYFRDYDPSLGRYGESDPIGLIGGLNTFLYGNGDPLRYMDPTGEAGLAGSVLLGGTALGVGIIMMSSSGKKGGSGSSSKSETQCPPNERDEYCEKIRKREEALCVSIAGPRYPGNPAQGIAVCMKAAFERYIKCRKGLPEHEWPPLTGVDTPI